MSRLQAKRFAEPAGRWESTVIALGNLITVWTGKKKSSRNAKTCICVAFGLKRDNTKKKIFYYHQK